jgi:acetyl esterase/lipase
VIGARRALALWSLALLMPADGAAQPPRPLTFAEVAALPAPAADHRVPYGAGPLQFGELRLPRTGRGPFPVVVLVHGGCWQGAYDLAHTRPMAAALAEAGFAVWAIEYRRLGDDGGGWPGTFQDVAAGTDHLRTLATAHRLDLSRVVAVGHSAGGQLVLWLASRTALPADSPLHVAQPLPLAGVVPLAPIADLAAYGAAPGGCNASVHPLVGGTPAEQPARYAQVDPQRRLPLRLRARLVHGGADRTVPPEQSTGWVAAARAAGDDAAVEVVAGLAHFDVIAPVSAAWPRVLEAIRALVAR